MLRIFRHYVSPIIFVFIIVEAALFAYVNFKVVIAKHVFLLVLTEDAHRCVFK